MQNETIKLPSKYVTIVFSTLLSAAIGFNAWAVAALYERPTKDDVTEMIEDKSPYMRDRAMILRALDEIQKDIRELTKAIRETHGADK